MRVHRALIALILLTPSLQAATHVQRVRGTAVIRHAAPMLASYHLHTALAVRTHNDPFGETPTTANAPSHATVLAYVIHLIQGFCRRLTA